MNHFLWSRLPVLIFPDAETKGFAKSALVVSSSLDQIGSLTAQSCRRSERGNTFAGSFCVASRPHCNLQLLKYEGVIFKIIQTVETTTVFIVLQRKTKTLYCLK